jgi:hypothetical protein
MGIHGIRHSTWVSKREWLVQSVLTELNRARHFFPDGLRCISCTGNDAGIDQAIIFRLARELRCLFQPGRPGAMWRSIPFWGELNGRPLKGGSGEIKMLGWLTVFAMLALCSLLTTLGGTAAIVVPAITASSLFAFLFFVFLLTTAIRGRP